MIMLVRVVEYWLRYSDCHVTDGPFDTDLIVMLYDLSVVVTLLL